MRSPAMLCVALVACGRVDAPRPRDGGEDGGVVVVVPGHRIGVVQVGMDRGALSRQHLPITLYDGSAMHLRAGPYDVVFNHVGRVARVSIPMDRAPEGLRILETPIAPGAGIERVIAVAPGCTPPVTVDGVPTLRCAAGGLLVQEVRGALVVSVTRELDGGR